MLLGTFTLTVVSCDKDDNQLEIKKETKVNNYDEDELEKDDWGTTPIKRPKLYNTEKTSLDNQELEKDDWGTTPIKRPKLYNTEKTSLDNQELEKDDWGTTPIKRPTSK